MNKERWFQIGKIIIASFLLLMAVIIKFDNKLVNNLLYFISYLIIGYETIFNAFKNIGKGEIFDENFLMTIATIGAFAINEFPEGCCVMLFYEIGEFFQSYATFKSRKSIASLMDIRPDYANLCLQDKIQKVRPEKVNVGDFILVKPGEKIPLDGLIINGKSSLNMQSLTGESLPREVKTGDEVLSGSINNEGILKIKVTKKYSESTVSKILDLVENASSRKAKSENFVRQFAKIYTPVVVFLTLLLAFVPPLVLKDTSLNLWLYRALSFLVVSCPCALVISIPLSFFGGIGASAKRGVLIKGSNYLESLAKVETIVCDKTGTLTKGVFKLQKINAINYSKDEVLKYAAYAESYSNHPISSSLKDAYQKKIDEKLITKTKELPGKGVIAEVQGKTVLVGNEKLMQENNIKYEKDNELGTVLYVAIDKKFAGFILIADEIKEDSYKAIKLFRENKVKKIVMLTGDQEDISLDVSHKLNLDECYAELLPQDKVTWIEKLQKESSFGSLVFIGDGINDAPALVSSDIGVCMGGVGSDAALEAADVVIMTDEIGRLANSIKIARKTMGIVKQNIILAITIKILVLLLSTFGYTTMWAAVFADVGVTIIAVLNALRVLKIKG